MTLVTLNVPYLYSETTHPDKPFSITFGTLQFGHAGLIRQIPSSTSPCELLVTAVTTYIYIKKLYLNIKNLEKKIIYILIVALKFRKPEQN